MEHPRLVAPLETPTAMADAPICNAIAPMVKNKDRAVRALIYSWNRHTACMNCGHPFTEAASLAGLQCSFHPSDRDWAPPFHGAYACCGFFSASPEGSDDGLRDATVHLREPSTRHAGISPQAVGCHTIDHIAVDEAVPWTWIGCEAIPLDALAHLAHLRKTEPPDLSPNFRDTGTPGALFAVRTYNMLAAEGDRRLHLLRPKGTVVQPTLRMLYDTMLTRLRWADEAFGHIVDDADDSDDDDIRLFFVNNDLGARYMYASHPLEFCDADDGIDNMLADDDDARAAHAFVPFVVVRRMSPVKRQSYRVVL